MPNKIGQTLSARAKGAWKPPSRLVTLTAISWSLNFLSEPQGTIESVEDIVRVRDGGAIYIPWTLDAVLEVLDGLNFHGYTQAEVIREANKNGGKVSRARVYELGDLNENQMLRGFTPSVNRVTAELQEEGLVPVGVPALLDAAYEIGVESTHFVVPHDLVTLFENADD